MHVLLIRMSWKSFWIFHILYLEFSGLFYYLIIKVCCCFSLTFYYVSALYFITPRSLCQQLFSFCCRLFSSWQRTLCYHISNCLSTTFFFCFTVALCYFCDSVLYINTLCIVCQQLFSEAVLTFQPTRFFFLRQRNIYYHAFHQLSISFLRYKNFLTEPVYFIGNEKFLIK